MFLTHPPPPLGHFSVRQLRDSGVALISFPSLFYFRRPKGEQISISVWLGDLRPNPDLNHHRPENHSWFEGRVFNAFSHGGAQARIESYFHATAAKSAVNSAYNTFVGIGTWTCVACVSITFSAFGWHWSLVQILIVWNAQVTLL